MIVSAVWHVALRKIAKTFSKISASNHRVSQLSGVRLREIAETFGKPVMRLREIPGTFDKSDLRKQGSNHLANLHALLPNVLTV